MDLLVLSGSTRRRSFNTRLADLVRQLRPAARVAVVKDLAALPFYDADLGAVEVPPAVASLPGAVAAAHQRLGERVDPDHVVQVTDVLAQALDAAFEGEPADESLVLA